MNADLQGFQIELCMIYRSEKKIVIETEVFDDDILNGPSYKSHQIIFTGVLAYRLNGDFGSYLCELKEMHRDEIIGIEGDFLEVLVGSRLKSEGAKVFKIESEHGLDDYIMCGDCSIIRGGTKE